MDTLKEVFYSIYQQAVDKGFQHQTALSIARIFIKHLEEVV